VRQEALGETFKAYAQSNYKTFMGTADLYVYFVERAHRLLKNHLGMFGIICSNKFMRANYGKPLRRFIADKTKILKIIDFGELPVFQNASTFPMIMVTLNSATANQRFAFAALKRLDFNSLDEEIDKINTTLDERSISDGNWTLADNDAIELIDKIKGAGVPLEEYVGRDIYRGILSGLKEAFIVDQSVRDRIIAENEKCSEFFKPFVLGDDVRKYRVNFRGQFLILIPKGWTNRHKGSAKDAWKWFKDNYKPVANHLLPFAKKAESRADKGDYWWELRACEYYSEFEKPKIVYPDIAKESRVAFDTDHLYFSNTVYFIPSDDLYLLALLNSRLLFNYFKSSAAVLGDPNKGGRLRWFTQDVLRIPIHVINDSNNDEQTKRADIVKLVEQILETKQKLNAAKNDAETNRLALLCTSLDRQIDEAVYELYGLTEEEVKIVEGK
jgi:hypothetical protein